MPTQTHPDEARSRPCATRSRSRWRQLNAHHRQRRSRWCRARPRRCSARARRMPRSCSSASSRATRRTCRAGPSSARPGSSSTARWRRPGIDRDAGLRHQCRQALQVRAARQAPHPREADRRRGQALPLVADEGARAGPAEARRGARRDGGAGADRQGDADHPRPRPRDLGGCEGYITVHPSYLLRLPDEDDEGAGLRALSSPTCAHPRNRRRSPRGRVAAERRAAARSRRRGRA